jgi:hypothetical protein
MSDGAIVIVSSHGFMVSQHARIAQNEKVTWYQYTSFVYYRSCVENYVKKLCYYFRGAKNKIVVSSRQGPPK